MRQRPLTSLSLLTQRRPRASLAPPRLDAEKRAGFDPIIAKYLVRPSINPNRQRVGQSGELPRTGGKGT